MSSHNSVAIGITSCVYPAGLKRLLDSIHEYTYGHYEIFVVMDGNEDHRRLDQLPQYKERFSHPDPGAGGKVDRNRFNEINAECPDYEFLFSDKKYAHVAVIRHEENLGPVAAFNTAFEYGAWRQPFVMLMNDDLIVQPYWLDCLLHVMKEFPDVVMTSFGNQDFQATPFFRKDPKFCLMGPASLNRSVYLRELIASREHVDDPQYKLFRSDSKRITEVPGRGHDVAWVAEPKLISHEWHQSLGWWVKHWADEDNQKPVVHDVNWGAQGHQERVGKLIGVKLQVVHNKGIKIVDTKVKGDDNGCHWEHH